MPVVAAVPVVSEIINRPIVMAVLMIEAASGRQVSPLEMAQMPLADCGGRVTRLFQRLWQRAFIQRQTVLRPRPDYAYLQTMTHRITPRHQSGACRRTDRLRVKLVEPRPPCRQFVEIGGLVLLAAVEAHIGAAQIVGQNQDDVWSVPPLA